MKSRRASRRPSRRARRWRNTKTRKKQLRDKWEEELKAAVEAEYRRQRADFLLALQWWLRDVWLQTLGKSRV